MEEKRETVIKSLRDFQAAFDPSRGAAEGDRQVPELV
jgi:hypothetical protein